MYQPTAFTSLNIPEILTGVPSELRTILPSNRFGDLGLGIRLLLPLSRSSKAISVANLLSLVFKFILYAIKKSLEPIIVAPLLGLNIEGP